MSRKIEAGQMMKVIGSHSHPDRAGSVGRVHDVEVWSNGDCIVTSIWLDYTPAGNLPQLSDLVEFRLYSGPGAVGRDVNVLERSYEESK